MFTIRSHNILTLFCPHSVFMCCVWISEQTAIISLHNINGLVFITETESVYCAVRTGSVTVIKADLVFQPPVPWLRPLDAGLLLRLLAFSPSSVHMKSVVDKMALEKIIVTVPCFYEGKRAMPGNLQKSNAVCKTGEKRIEHTSAYSLEGYEPTCLKSSHCSHFTL